jgi:hypothetical protein
MPSCRINARRAQVQACRHQPGWPQTALELIGTRSPGCTDKAPLFREGLFAFELEDYVKCIHVVFQVENSLRELLRLLGCPVSKAVTKRTNRRT